MQSVKGNKSPIFIRCIYDIFYSIFVVKVPSLETPLFPNRRTI